MTRKDYNAIADAIACAFAERERLASSDIGDRFLAGMSWGIEASISQLCSVLTDDNPRFDSVRFREACRATVATTV